MATNKSSFVNQVLIYGLGLALNYGIGFILLPVYTRLMPAEQYGVLEILSRTMDIISVLLLAQFGTTYIRFFRDQADESYRRRVTSTCIIVMVFVAAVIAALIAVFSASLSRLLFQSESYAHYVVLSGVRYFMTMATIVPFLYFQATEQPGKYIAASSSYFAAALGLNILLLCTMDDKIAAVLWAPIIAAAAFLLTVGLWVFLRSWRRLDLGIAKEIVKFTWSFTFLGIYSFIMTNGDRYFLNEYCGKTAVGLYSAAYKIPMVLNTFVFSPMIRAWTARMVDVLRQPDGTRLLARLTTYALLLYAIGGLVMSVYSREMISVLMGRSYFECYLIVPLIVLAYAFDGVSTFVDSGLYYTKKLYLKIWHGVTTAVCLGLYFWLIPKHCMTGAAWATVGTYFGFVALTCYLSIRALPTKYEFGKMARITLAAIGIYLVNYFLEEYEFRHLPHLRLAAQLAYPWLYLVAVCLLKAPLILLYALLLKTMRIFEPEDMARIKEFYNSLRSRISPKTGADLPTPSDRNIS